MAKPKISVYWAGSCGGCEISVTNIHEKILDVDANFELFFCPCLVDGKKKDVEALKDGEILLTLFNGAIRTEENLEMAHLMRKKSKILVAFGSCAYEGCIPGIANLCTAEDILKSSYIDCISVDNPNKIIPQPSSKVKEGELTIPKLMPKVQTLADVIDVDYFIPGCPPEPHQVGAVIDLIISGKPLPPKGAVIGAGTRAVCAECTKIKTDKKISKLYRTYEIIPNETDCLLEQGMICMGIATREGCGALCPKVNMPCNGCYGPPQGVLDQGAKMASALGSIIDIEKLKGRSEESIPKLVDEVLNSIPDYTGTFYKFSMPHSMLRGKK